MKRRELMNLGYSMPDVQEAALKAVIDGAKAGMKNRELREALTSLIVDPDPFCEHPLFGAVAALVVRQRSAPPGKRPVRHEPVPWKNFCEGVEGEALKQMEQACLLPISVQGALMPDAHVGYGLPIGGVLATERSVVPYAVGVDIACRMKLSVFDLPTHLLKGGGAALEKAIETETRFGVGASFERRRDHAVMEADWNVTPLTRRLRDKAWAQLGTSGSGNHFVEFGILTVEREGLQVPPGTYLSLLSHSGSRGAGGEVAGHYSRLALELHRDLPDDLKRLAWLELDSDPGREYWAAMELMGEYAKANHAMIHYHIARHLKARVLWEVENHHNFAWKEALPDGREVVVHRKGATPAGPGVLGIIPGSMATPGYLVRGKGNSESLYSASHGAGRRMSRTKATQEFTWSQTRKMLDLNNVRLISGGLDECPMAYKDIEHVMAAQTDLVDVLAKFEPRLVKMAPPGERAED